LSEEVELTYIPSLLVQSPLPVRDPKGNEFIRRSGNQEVKIISSPGVPFGHIGRLTLALAVTDALRNHSNRVELGTVTGWLARLDTAATGGKEGSIGRVKEQFNRIGQTMITVSAKAQHSEGFQQKTANFVIADELELFWDKRVSLSEMPTLFQNFILFSPKFYDYLTNHAVPVDLAVYDKFQAPLAQDIYAWLAWKLHNLDSSLPLSWSQIEAQFSDGPSSNPRQWRKRWALAAVEVIALGYGDAKVDTSVDGVVLHPSPKAVKPRETGYLF
jgi:hypothetical protein